MPLNSFQHTPITVEVPDSRDGLKQLAVFNHLGLDVADSGRLTLLIGTGVQLHLPADDGGYGRELSGPAFSPPPVTLRADARTAVYYNPDDPADPRNGQPLYFRRGIAPADWGTLDDDGTTFTPLPTGLEATKEPLLLQCDFVELLLLNLLAPMIRQHMAAAAGPPYNRYS